MTYDVALLDMHMPAMDGVALGSALKALEHEHRPLVLPTSLGLKPAKLERSFSAFLTKPVKQSVLNDTLVRVLRGFPDKSAPAVHDCVAVTKPSQILHAEDNLINQRVAKLMLAKLGHQVDTAMDGCEAVAAAADYAYDVLMDVQMPRMDGFGATRRIRSQNKAGQNPYSVDMTANALREDRGACLSAAMQNYLSKPVGLHELHDVLTRTVVQSARPRITADAAAFDELASQFLVDEVSGQADAARELANEYLAESQQVLAHLGDAVAAQDQRRIRSLAHTWRSTSALMGARALTELLRQVESGAAQAPPQLEQLVEGVTAEFALVHEALARHSSKGFVERQTIDEGKRMMHEPKKSLTAARSRQFDIGEAVSERERDAESEVSLLLKDVDALSVELLSRYEEITLLYDLARDLGVVLDIATVANAALVRSVQVIPALVSIVAIRDDGDDMRIVAEHHAVTRDDHRLALAVESARVAVERGSRSVIHTIGRLPTASEPILVAPLVGSQGSGGNPTTVGAVVYVGHASGDRFSAGEASLAEVMAQQLSQGMANAAAITQLRHMERLESQLELAAGIQRSLLPKRIPALPGANFAAHCLPAAQVGGDYFDFVPATNGIMSFLVADVSGHGLGPGLIMAMTRSVLRAELSKAGSLTEHLHRTNSVMWEDLSAAECFITLFVATFDPTTHRLRYVNAGHHPALLRRADGTIQELTSFGMPLGILSTSAFEEDGLLLAPGDAVVIFSDGVVEAAAQDGTFFGMDRLLGLLGEAGSDSAEELVMRITSSLQAFHGPDGQEDDVTVLALRLATELG